MCPRPHRRRAPHPMKTVRTKCRTPARSSLVLDHRLSGSTGRPASRTRRTVLGERPATPAAQYVAPALGADCADRRWCVRPSVRNDRRSIPARLRFSSSLFFPSTCCFLGPPVWIFSTPPPAGGRGRGCAPTAAGRGPLCRPTFCELRPHLSCEGCCSWDTPSGTVPSRPTYSGWRTACAIAKCSSVAGPAPLQSLGLVQVFSLPFMNLTSPRFQPSAFKHAASNSQP